MRRENETLNKEFCNSITLERRQWVKAKPTWKHVILISIVWIYIRKREDATYNKEVCNWIEFGRRQRVNPRPTWRNGILASMGKGYHS